MTEPVEKSLITDDQRLKAWLLARLPLDPDSYTCAFVRDMNALADKNGNPKIAATDAQLLDRIYWLYRGAIQDGSHMHGLRIPEFIDPAANGVTK